MTDDAPSDWGTAEERPRATALMGLKLTSVITLNAADSRELIKMLDAPAREPNDYMKAALADYRRLIRP